MKPEESLILIVDDTPANLRLLSHVLTKEGYEYIEASNGHEAIELAKKHEPDLILLDIMMPDISGFEVVKRIKANQLLEDTPVIFLSSLSDTEDKVQGFKYGGVDYITKPFQKEETLARIKTHLQIRSLQKQLNERIKILREREIELSRLNQKKDDLVRTVSHDIKNPLTGIIGLVKLMRDSDKITAEEQTQMLSVIEESGTNLLNLVREVLDRESKKIEPEELEYSTVSITELFERVVSMNKAKSVVKNVKLDYSVSPAGIKLEADQTKIEIAVNNLVSNALKFTPSGGEVAVHAIQNNGSLEIRVQDTGIGIPVKLQEDLFTNPNQPSRNGTNGEVGTGLGLDIVQLYVELHEGKIWVESELDKGTTFFISLPLEEKLA
ncbi:hybrid sensor histidine kinase/response regulator [Gracilimonas sediminicola]|uniref:histidine kinase n=1 Tax=Gracilimonas sediminicola TaxID=2952158 RepID=A0A9X2L5S4_9BACT|nr:hybrid sensor histidine kinase/response regulator [Gracilimonas sediminicola]MCP9292824.1 hybrid sensor histidine kinase/response regulator [Gracilimonas sediminicola]